MNVSRSAYYEWLSTEPKMNNGKMRLNNTIQRIFEKSRKTYGSRRLVKALEKEGYQLGRYQVRSLMRELALEVRYPKRVKNTTDSNHGLEVAPNMYWLKLDLTVASSKLKKCRVRLNDV